MTFKEKVIDGLVSYKAETLGIKDPGIFRYKGKNLEKDHILPKRFYRYNILNNYREAFFTSNYQFINFHRYFHHLNSSQALCINLFLPLIYEEDLWTSFFNFINLESTEVNNIVFEKESDLEKVEKGGRKTNFDFYMQTSSQEIYFEIKYTENGFASTKQDEEHIKKFHDTYKQLLKENSYIRDEYKSMPAFFNNYQIMRNLLHISHNQFVIFTIPKGNEKVFKQAVFARDKILTEKGKSRFRILCIEDFIDYMLDSTDSSLRDYFQEFQRKYFTITV